MSNFTGTFDSIEILINEKFEKILQCVNLRRENLLSELASLRVEYKSKIDSNQKTLEELEKMRAQLENVFIHQNQAMQIHESALQQITKERDALKASINQVDLSLILECDISPILEKISLLGKLVQDEDTLSDDLAPPLPPRVPSPRSRSASLVPEFGGQAQTLSYPIRSVSLESSSTASLPPKLSLDDMYCHLTRKTSGYRPPLPIRASSYNGKHLPIYSSGHRGCGPGYIDAPLGLAYNPNDNKVYVVDNGSHKVVVFSSKGVYDTEFGLNILRKPHSIAIKGYYCCVTDEELNGVVKFKLSTFSMIKVQAFRKGGDLGEMNRPRGIDIDDEHNVYIADSINNRICILNADLYFIRVFLDNFLQLPQDVRIIHEMVYVLDRNGEFSIHSFTKCGNLIQSVLSPSKDVFFPSFFTTDFAGQLLVTDADTQGVKVFSLDGDVCIIVGEQTSVWDSTANGATGVCVTKEGKVVCAFSDGKYPLCFY